MALDPRTPVIVGAGQLTQRCDPADALEPVDMMAEAARRAAADATSASVLAALQSVRVVNLLSWRYLDPAALVAERVGASPAETAYTPMGGNTPQSLVNTTALDIQAGRLDVAMLTGGEAVRTRNALRKLDQRPDWTEQPEGTAPTTILGKDVPMNHPHELSRGVVMPVQIYPMVENALRAAAGRSLADHHDRISRLWSRFSEVAATNPHAWIQQARTAEEIGTASPANRMVGFPYPKLMNSNNDVDQAAAVIMCSVEAARAHGIPEERWVFPWSGSDAHDHPYVSHRDDLHSSPAIRIAGGRALSLAGVGVDDLTHVDLYSCFPSAVQIGADELGLSLERDLTVTGGLSFFGGPWNDYVMHSIATMVELLRGGDDIGLVTANGGYVTKHAFGVYSARPPATPFRNEDVQAEVDALPARALAEEHDGPVTVETYTVMHERDGSPATAFAACLTPDGARTWATSTDAEVMEAMVTEEVCGRPGTVADATLQLS